MPKHPVQVRHGSLAAQVEANGLLPEEQRALRKGARGCMDCLAVDRRVMAYLGAGHDPCTRMGESHSWSPSFNVEDSNGDDPLFTSKVCFKWMPYRPFSSVLPFFFSHKLAKCDALCKLQNSVNHRVFECKWRSWGLPKEKVV